MQMLQVSISHYLNQAWIWQTLVLLLLIGIVYLYTSRKYYRTNIKRFIKRRTKTIVFQNEQILKQKELLENEHLKSEDLLKNIFPNKFIKVLKNKGNIEPEYYKEADILFADFVSFSKITPQLTANELVDTLNIYFKKFDSIITEQKMVLIKTIGDCYFAVGGIPKMKSKSSVRSVLAGLQMQEAVKLANKEKGLTWQIRVGINSGEIAAGVLDTKRPMFDVWGSAVNVASRIQDAGEPQRVNISESVYVKIFPFFDCERRGKIETKNVGKISMYFVNGIKPIFSKNGEGLIPNEKFWEYKKALKNSKPDYIRLTRDTIKLIKKELPPSIYYHTEKHALNIMNAVEIIGFGEGIFTEDILLLKTAALFHDIGFLETYPENEAIGAKYAEKTLPNYGFSEEQIKLVVELIMATKITHTPTNLLEEIIKDADLDYLGRNDFEDISNKLMNEFIENKVVSSKNEFLEMQVSFFEKHKYYTKTANELRNETKKHNAKIALSLYNSQTD